MTADRAAAFKAALGQLNSQFASWVAQQQKEAPNALWAAGARSYCEHAARLAKEFGDVLSTANGSDGDGEGGSDKQQPSAKKAKPAAAPAAAPAAGAPLFDGLGGGGTTAAGTTTFNFGGSAAAAGAPAAAAPTSSLFGAPPAAAAGTTGGLFGAPPPPATGSSLFGAPPTGTFNFGGSSAAPATTGGFGFGGPGGAAAAAAAADDDDNAEEQAAEEQTETVLNDGGATILFKEKAKLHTQGPDKKWVDRGAGVLTVRAPNNSGEGSGEGAGAGASTSRRPYIVFTTDSGRVLLNAACYRGLAAMKARKPHMVTASLANAAAAAGGESGGGGAAAAAAPQISPTLFNLFAEGAADKFVAVLKEAASK